MALTARQAVVFANLDRVVSDGARCDTRYELDGVNVSQQMRALIAQGLVVVGPSGTVSKRDEPPSTMQSVSSTAVAEEMRLLLLAQPTPKKR